MELKRADFGFGRVVIDESGVARRGLFRTRRVAWDEISEYALEMTPTVDASAYREYSLTPVGELAYLRDAVQGMHRAYLVHVELRGGAQPVAFGWRFRDAHLAVHEIVERVHGRLARRARDELDRLGLTAFGPLGLAAESIAWGAKSLPRERVEAIEIFDAKPLELRVMARGETWPFARAPTRAIPNLLVALALARDLGYATRGNPLVRDVFARPG